jgi:hypothetical protein
MLANRGASTKMKQTALGTARMAEHYSRAYDKRTLLRRLSGCFHGL